MPLGKFSLPGNTQFPIVALGASAGGLEPLQAFFGTVRPGSHMAFVVVSHLAPDRDSMLVEILGRSAGIPVQLAEDGAAIEAERTYVIPPGSFMTLEAGRLKLTKAKKPSHPHNTIDVFFSSLAENSEEKAVGIILSGSGGDGTLGIKAIKEKGGLVLAQGADDTPLRHSAMPDSAISTGLVDYILPPQLMLRRISGYFDSAKRIDNPGAKSARRAVDRREQICNLLREQTGHDFIGYKPTTFMRRVQRRMQVLHLAKIEDYVSVLRANPAEVTALFRDLLIGVTYFFRDPDVFDLLARDVVPQIFKDKAPTDDVRVWVPGCATGEEVYSLAMILTEYAARLPQPPKILIIGTDIDEAALSVARQGHYPAALLADISEARRGRFFTSDGMTYTVRKDIRDLCIFSMHNIIQDPPFSRIDLISCRNLLIYMGTDLQTRAVPVFHYALRPSRFLLLGLTENVTHHSDLFTPIDKKNRIFRRVDHVSPSRPLPMFQAAQRGRTSALIERTEIRDSTSLRHTVNAYVLEHLAPPHVVVDRAGNLIHASAHTGRYLELAAGQPVRYLLSMARKGLRLDLRSALSEAMETMRPVMRQHVEVEVDDRLHLINLHVRPLPSPGHEPCFLVAFEEVGPPRAQEPADTARAGVLDSNIQQLEQELRDTRDRPQSMIEEYETSLEETKSTNEELVSLNEELQSANEELETSKEEIQSVNEELQTVNLELQAKVDELDSANSDLRNLFASTKIAIVFLGSDLKIRTFTPEVANIFKLIPSDQGRPLTDLASHLQLSGLKDDIQSVLGGGVPVERRVDDHGESHYLMRIFPYRSSKSVIDGVLVTFVDVKHIVTAENHLRTLVHELNHRVRNMLTVVLAMVQQTARRTMSPGEFVEVFSGRLQAMAKAYDVVSNEQWQAVELDTLIRSQISPYAAGKNTVSVSGRKVWIKPKAALALGMVVHEMTTNAVKYGALSVPAGRVEISWITERTGERSDLVLGWHESEGPPVSKPKTTGFGSTLIERELEFELNGKADLRFEPAGLVASFRIPIGSETIAVRNSPPLDANRS